MMISLLIGELTNPFNIFRQVLDADGREEDGKVHGKIFIVSFIICRVFFGPVIAWWFCVQPGMHVVLKFMCCFMSSFRLKKFGLDTSGHGEL